MGQTILSTLKLAAIGAVLVLQWVVLGAPVFATETIIAPLRITEIYPDAPNPESGKEYIEIANISAIPINLEGYQLQIKEHPTKIMPLSGTIDPGEYQAFLTSFTLVNTGDTIQLIQLSEDEEVLIEEVAYTATAGEEWSWTYGPHGWEQAPPTPNLPYQQEEDTEDEDVSTTPPVDSVEDPETEEDFLNCEIVITEISAQNNLAGKEYIEFYQSSGNPMFLQQCTVQINGKSAKALPDVILMSDAYYIWELGSGNISNNGGVIVLQHSNGEILSYPYSKTVLGEVSNYNVGSVIEEVSNVPTPGKANLPSQNMSESKVAVAQQAVTALADCGTGRYRHPETNRCRNIETATTTLMPCAEGQERNPETNRCRKISTATTASSLVPCKEGQERNPATNRCRQLVTAASSTLKPCAEGQERNPETNRCRKIASTQNLSVPLEQDATQPPQPLPLKVPVISALSAAIIGYGGYEYRSDIRRLFSRFRSTRRKYKPPG